MSSLYEEVKCAFCGAVLSTAGLCPNQYQHTRQRLDAEAATAEGCSRCGFMALTGHDCPELDVPPDAAVPWRHRPTLSLASSAALAEDGLDYLSRQQAASANPAACADAILCARAHIAALTAERDAQQAEIAFLRADVEKMSKLIACLEVKGILNPTAVLSGKIEALEWAKKQAMCANWRDLGERIKAEIVRLRSQEKQQ